MAIDEFIERRIITGMVVSTEYMQFIAPIWDHRLIVSSTAITLGRWCIDYYTKYNKAIGKNIEAVYAHKLRTGLNKSKATDIEEILSGLSEDYEREQFNLDYLTDQTRLYFQERRLLNLSEDIKVEISNDRLTEAEKLINGYTPPINEESKVVDLFSNVSRVEKAFEERKHPLVRFPRALGHLLNDQLTRDAFVAFLGIEKIGKTFMLLELAIRAIESGCNVAFFEAGDMSENQIIRRIGIRFTKRSDLPRYCEPMYIPVIDCKLNQKDKCKRACRECDFGVFSNNTDLETIGYEAFVEAVESNPDYKACRNCPKCYDGHGAVWFARRGEVRPLTWKDAAKYIKQFHKRYKKRFKLCSYPNETLTISEIKALLDSWERADGFVPDVIVVDYADLLASDVDCTRLDFRNQENKKWQRLRRLSQEKHCLVVTATQASASGYDHQTLQLKDFSEDKRKYAHVTAMWGLNQTPTEKKIGIMRVNEMVVREGDFDRAHSIRVLQRLQMGRPYLTSFR